MPKKLQLARVAKRARGVTPLLADVRELILAAREGIARTINAGLTLLYWEIGTRIRRDVLKEKRAEYGEQIVSALSAQLGWTHFRRIIYLDDQLKRDFYAEMCRIEKWSTRTLEKKIGGMLYERTALSKTPDKLIRQELAALREEDNVTPDFVFRDPYVLDFLGLRNTYAEKDLEAAILREMEAFILELGVGFAFLERQRRITVVSLERLRRFTENCDAS
ncbi:MAG: PDDEXK nuclease domain-containing protein [Verrucomicrobiales bacterium]|nr:PDDEXK nuclease domain-containing protein [Verrucomicrobiales bacterium]